MALLEYKPFVGGEFVSTTEKYEATCSWDGSAIATVLLSGNAELEQAIEKAGQAKKTWPNSHRTSDMKYLWL